MTENNVKKTILVAEDDQFLMKVYSTKLKTLDCEVLTAMDGEEALNLVKQHHPDLVLLDVIMPKKNGFDVLAAIKADPATKDVRVLILSNLGQDEDSEKAKALGAEEFVVKAHAGINDIFEKIKGYLGQNVASVKPQVTSSQAAPSAPVLEATTATVPEAPSPAPVAPAEAPVATPPQDDGDTGQIKDQTQ